MYEALNSAMPYRIALNWTMRPNHGLHCEIIM